MSDLGSASAEGLAFTEKLVADHRDRWVPRALQLPADGADWLREMFPGLDPDAIDWCLGLPWFLGPGTWVHGMAMPHPWKPGRVRIYLKHWNPSDPDGLSLLVHETVHVWQIQQAAQKGTAIGIWHPFLLQYFASWIRHGYRHHPLELPAYSFEAAFDDQAWAFPNPACDTDAAALPLLVPPGLVCPDALPAYQDGFWRKGMAAAMLFPAAVLVPLVEVLAKLLFSLRGRTGKRTAEIDSPS